MKLSFKRKILGLILRPLMFLFTKTEFFGSEHIPEEGPVIIVTNHLSRLDIPVLFMTPKRKEIRALVTDKYLNYPILNIIILLSESIWLDRTKADYTAFRKAEEILNEGIALGISPEGTRSKNGQLQAGKPGAALLASKTGVTIVPVGITGTDTGVSDLLHFKRPHLIARYGPSFTLEPLNRNEDRNKKLRLYTDDVMCRIAALLPEEYRGVYADHPDLAKYLN